MARKRCTWNTVETAGMFELQKNEYEEIRVAFRGKSFRTFHGQNAYADARRYWESTKEIAI